MGLFGKKASKKNAVKELRKELDWVEQEIQDEEVLKGDALKQANKCAAMERAERKKHKRHDSSDNLLECQMTKMQEAGQHLGRIKQLKDKERAIRFGKREAMRGNAPPPIEEMEEDMEEEDVDIDIEE